MMKSSIDSAKANRLAAKMPGRINGKVTFQKVRAGDAPRSCAACSSVQSNPRMRARTVSATKLTWNMMWAMMIVMVPKDTKFCPKNSVASDEPSTISGAVSGSTRKKLKPFEPLN